MCTAICWQGSHFYFGRNLDLEQGFGECVTAVPRGFLLQFASMPPVRAEYAMIGVAAEDGAFPLFAEAVNERGLCAAGLNFPHSARYAAERGAGRCIAPHEMVAALLAHCADTRQARAFLEGAAVIAAPYRGYPVPPLHWMVADRYGCLAVEPREGGLRIYENAAGVLANEPPFAYHQWNLKNYCTLTAAEAVPRFGLPLEPYTHGMGAVGLPGDASSPSRFVRAAFYRANSRAAAEDEVAQFFHLLGSVEMVRGGVLTKEGRCCITRYACCIDADAGMYYLKTYQNSRITAYPVHAAGKGGMRRFALPAGEDILFAE